MQIETKTIELKKPQEINTSFIESCFKELGIEVIRWAIVEVKEFTLTLDVAIVSD